MKNSGRTIRFLAGLLVTTSGMVTYHTACAQTGPAPAAADNTGLQDIVVTARRVGESAQKTPVSITSFTGEALKRAGTTSVFDLAHDTPSLQVMENNTNSAGLQISLRGQVQTDTSAIAADSVGVYIDDVYDGAAGISAGLLNFDDLQRVEVLKGPQGTLYGRNVTGGVVKFVTNKPTDKLEAWVTGGLGNYDRHYIGGGINLPLVEDKLALRVVGSFDEHGGYSHDIVSNLPLDDMHKWNVRASLKANPTNNVEILLEGWYAKGHDHGSDIRNTYLQPTLNPGLLNVEVQQHINGITAATLAPIFFSPSSPAGAAAISAAVAGIPGAEAAVQNILNAPRSQAQGNPLFPQSDHSIARGASGTVSVELGNVALKSITAYNYGSRDSYFVVGGAPFDPLYTNQGGGNSQFTEELQANGKAFHDRLKFALGAFYLHSIINDNRDIGTEFGAFPLLLGQYGLGVTNGSIEKNHQIVKSEALYGQASYAIISSLNATVGLRYTHETSRATYFGEELPSLGTGPDVLCIGPSPDTTATPLSQCAQSQSDSSSNLSYTYGLDYTVVPNVLVYAKSSRGFKAGGVNGYPAPNAPFTTYKPEQDTDYEAGIKSDLLDRHLRLNLTYYHTNYTNIQRAVGFVVPGGGLFTATRNAASAKIDGVEAEMQLVPVRGVTLSANGAYTAAHYLSYTTANLGYPGGVEDLSGEPFAGIAKYTYSVTAAYDFSAAGTNVHAQVNWTHRSSSVLFANDSQPSTFGGTDFEPYSALTQPAFGLLNAGLTFDLPKYNSTLTIWGKNILNKRYFESIEGIVNNGVGVGWGSFGPPATVGADLTIRFR